MRFSGHDTFACRTTWLFKGIDFLNSRRDSDNQIDINKSQRTSTHYRSWSRQKHGKRYQARLLAFGIVDTDENDFGELAQLIYADGDDDNNLDAFIEDKFTLWVLHHEICTRQYASIFHYFFKEYFKRKSTRTFRKRNLLAL